MNVRREAISHLKNKTKNVYLALSSLTSLTNFRQCSAVAGVQRSQRCQGMSSLSSKLLVFSELSPNPDRKLQYGR
jgi:hypothetical protein